MYCELLNGTTYWAKMGGCLICVLAGKFSRQCQFVDKFLPVCLLTNEYCSFPTFLRRKVLVVWLSTTQACDQLLGAKPT